MKQVLIRGGQVTVDDVPASLVEEGCVLVEVAYSLISVGTEMSTVESSGKSIFRQVVEQPEKVMRLVEHLGRFGVKKTVEKLHGRLTGSGLGIAEPIGYSCSGVVIQVGRGIDDIRPGDMVACAGSGRANHAEIVSVPRNLVVKVPDGCNPRDAATVTLGAIAMQGVRRADPRLGEVVAVIGLGLIGQITVQLLKASGCRVLGIDPDARRVNLAEKLGMDVGLLPSEVDVSTEVLNVTDGHGVDASVITAASQSDEIVQQAMQITRRKGKVVVVGAVGLGLKRSPFYEKEIDLLISCSYGPGRYDKRYEERGIDYPYAYVRWTENRNMAGYLRLVADGDVDVKTIIEREYPVQDAPRAYEELKTSPEKPLGVLLSYGPHETARPEKMTTRVVLNPDKPVGRKIKIKINIKTKEKINVALVGAGGFARDVHLPNLRELSDLYQLRAVVSRTGSTARNTGELFGAEYVTTDYDDVLSDPEVDVVLISTRHNLHAAQTIRAAEAGKAVFLEKPMALNRDELGRMVEVLSKTGVPFMVGFNRRFSPAARRAKELLAGHHGPLMVLYRVNAGYIPLDHWVHTEEGGGRIRGEACHMFDLFQYMVEPAGVVEVVSGSVTPGVEHFSASDNVSVLVKYDDGSMATLFYTAMGDSGPGKERVEIYADRKVLLIDDFRELRVYGTSAQGWKSAVQDKGHVEELRAFARHVRGESGPPIALEKMAETTEVGFAASGRGD